MFASRLRLAASSGTRTARRGFAAAAAAARAAAPRSSQQRPFLAAGVAMAAGGAIVAATAASSVTALDARLPSSGDVISTGTPVKEAATGILFPQLCNGYYLAGECGNFRTKAIEPKGCVCHTAGESLTQKFAFCSHAQPLLLLLFHDSPASSRHGRPRQVRLYQGVRRRHLYVTRLDSVVVWKT